MKILLIDANSLIHRAFHALPPLTTSDGRPSGALYGLSSLLLKILREQKPDYAAAAFDRPEKTFRKELFENYKATRPTAPDELITQIIEARKTFDAFGIPTFEKAGYEADDIIGTLAEKFGENAESSIIILTGDLDTLQLIRGDKTVVMILKKGVSEVAVYDENAVVERYGLHPLELVDYKGLVGDKSDNIPGVKNIGPKTAEKLISRHGKLENLFASPDLKDPAVLKALPHKDIALLSKKLATIDRNVPLVVEAKKLRWEEQKEKLEKYFREWNFGSLAQRIGIKTFPEKPGGTEKVKENTKILNAFFVSSATDLTETRLISKNTKVAWEWKPIIKELMKQKRDVPANLFDLSIAAWLLDPDGADFSPSAIAEKYSSSEWSNLFPMTKRRLEQNGLEHLFESVEMPLVEVLAKMELTGIRIDRGAAEDTQKELRRSLEKLSSAIYREAGTTFNINSPEQVSKIVFEKLKIKPGKTRKTKGGRLSTSFDALSRIKDVEIIRLLLEYREGFKMLTTYLKPILDFTGDDGRLRTTFLQTGTSTGRIASEKPNLQNIPQESAWSKKIRDAFTAENGFTLVSFDYSQLELRLLAHVSDDNNLKDAFRKGTDIHQLTASQIFGVPLHLVTKKERRIGKTLNFGIVYGMGARSLSETSGVSFAEAEAFIKKYFAGFPSIQAWQEQTKAGAAQRGFVSDLNGRKRWFRESPNPRMQAENERAAINMPIQGLGADILKKAMIASNALVKTANEMGDSARLLLAIHDELLFEIRDDILMDIVPRIVNAMEYAEKLGVPLTVDVKQGKRWGSLETYERTSATMV